MTDHKPWECRARPAPGGEPCGFKNVGAPVRHNGLVVCASCGCTKKASDDRARSERLAAGNALRLDRDHPLERLQQRIRQDEANAEED